MANIAKLLTEHINIWTAAESEKKSGRGRVSGNAGGVYGVKKLRELILELAVRGKLVPQDPNDEPASELLKRIQTEKAKLIAEGKLKKEKPLSLINEDEKPFELPKGWDWTRLQDVYDVRDGTHDTPKYQETGFPLVTSKNLYSGRLNFSDIKYISEQDHLKIKDRSKVDKGDILFAMIGSIGNPVIVDTNIEFSIKNVALFKPYSAPLSDTSYLLKYLIKATINLREEAAGAVQSFVSLGVIRNYLIPLPPLAEQHRIVAKVDELMALCDQLEQQHGSAQEAHETLVSQLLATLTQNQNAAEFNANWQRISAHFDVLFTTEASINALKQTLLQLAVMGKLVLQDPNDQPASKLLKHIQAEKAKLIAEGKLKKEKPQTPITDDEKPFELPNGWEWTTLLNAAVVNPRNNASDNIEASFVPMTYIGSEFSDKHQAEKRLWKDIKQGFTHFAEGDIGVAKITPCFENSKACVFENLENGLGAGTTELHIVRPVGNTLNPRYVLAYLKSPRFLELGESKMTGTAGQKRLPKDFVELNPFPLPPLPEQYRIVAKVDEVMALCDKLKTRIQQASQQKQLIADALVAQAVA